MDLGELGYFEQLGAEEDCCCDPPLFLFVIVVLLLSLGFIVGFAFGGCGR